MTKLKSFWFSKIASIGLLILLSGNSHLFSQEKFYNYYEKGMKYIQTQDWLRAIAELRSASSLEFEDKNKKRTYGTRFIEYYPHREMGIAHYFLGELGEAKNELELSIAYKPSDRAKEFLNKIKSGVSNDPNADKLATEKLKQLEAEENLAKQKELAANVEQDRLKKLREEEGKKKQEVFKKQEEEQKKLKIEQDRIAKEKVLLAQKEVEQSKKQQELAEKQKLEEEKKRLKEQEEKAELERKRLAKLEEEKKKKEEEERKQQAIALKKAEEERKKLEEEKARIEKEKAALAVKRASEAKKNINVSGLAYDPSRVVQVGSRLSIAVLPFETFGAASDINRQMAEKLVTQLVNFRRFRVIERTEMDKVVKEQDFSSSDLADEKSAAKLGKLAGADVIVVGTIVIQSGFAKVTARLLDVETGEAIVAKEVQTKNPDIESIERGIEALSVLIYNDLPIFEGYIVSIEGEQIYIDMGSDKGMRKGMKCVAFKEGDPIVHPITKEVLGKKVTKLGELVITQVQEKLSVAKFIEQEGEKVEVSSKVVIK